MTNHIHMVANVKSCYSLSSFINSFKSYVAKHILKQLKHNSESRNWILNLLKKEDGSFQFWTKSNHPIILYSEKVTAQKIDYIHMNPVKTGIVAYPFNYKYCSASFYENGKCELIHLDVV